MQPIRHLFWDFDGTLYDSYPQITHAFVQTLDALGQRGLFSETELLAALKVSVYYAACQCAQRAGLEPSNVMDVFHRYHAQEAAFPPYEGLESCLRRGYAITCTRTAIGAPSRSSSRTAYGRFSPTPLPGRTALPISPHPTRFWP